MVSACAIPEYSAKHCGLWLQKSSFIGAILSSTSASSMVPVRISLMFGVFLPLQDATHLNFQQTMSLLDSRKAYLDTCHFLLGVSDQLDQVLYLLSHVQKIFQRHL